MKCSNCNDLGAICGDMCIEYTCVRTGKIVHPYMEAPSWCPKSQESD